MVVRKYRFVHYPIAMYFDLYMPYICRACVQFCVVHVWILSVLGRAAVSTLELVTEFQAASMLRTLTSTCTSLGMATVTV